MPATAMTASTVEFATAARNLAREARRRGLVGPSFRCPPRLVGLDRTIRWYRAQNASPQLAARAPA